MSGDTPGRAFMRAVALLDMVKVRHDHAIWSEPLEFWDGHLMQTRTYTLFEPDIRITHSIKQLEHIFASIAGARKWVDENIR